MKKHLLILGLAPVLALAACGGERTANTTDGMADANMEGLNTAGMDMSNDAAMGDNMAAEASPAQRFANDVGASDYYEVEAGKLAQEKAQSQGLKDFGRKMVEHHTQSTEKLKAAGAKANPAIVPNPTLTGEQETNLAALRAAEGAAFDQAYKAQQIAAHEKALALVQGYAASGDVPDLKAFASEAQKLIQTHLTEIRGM